MCLGVEQQGCDGLQKIGFTQAQPPVYLPPVGTAISQVHQYRHDVGGGGELQSPAVLLALQNPPLHLS